VRIRVRFCQTHLLLGAFGQRAGTCLGRQPGRVLRWSVFGGGTCAQQAVGGCAGLVFEAHGADWCRLWGGRFGFVEKNLKDTKLKYRDPKCRRGTSRRSVEVRFSHEGHTRSARPTSVVALIVIQQGRQRQGHRLTYRGMRLYHERGAHPFARL
jgi:hypothetical protein